MKFEGLQIGTRVIKGAGCGWRRVYRVSGRSRPGECRWSRTYRD